MTKSECLARLGIRESSLSPQPLQFPGHHGDHFSASPIGTMLSFAPGSELPPGWIPADGRSVEIARYPYLFKMTGEAYDWDADQGTFNVPDLKGRIKMVQPSPPAPKIRTPDEILRLALRGELHQLQSDPTPQQPQTKRDMFGNEVFMLPPGCPQALKGR